MELCIKRVEVKLKNEISALFQRNISFFFFFADECLIIKQYLKEIY